MTKPRIGLRQLAGGGFCSSRSQVSNPNRIERGAERRKEQQIEAAGDAYTDSLIAMRGEER